jgi:phosphoribosylaminoimidazole-succinocarboxamide synthase
MPEGMRENDPFPAPLITPSTKADVGHDEDIAPDEILKRGLCTPKEWDTMCGHALDLFKEGSRLAKERGLILVDTKYEFGRTADGRILLIDEIHTPDSSRYFHLDGYAERQAKGERQKQLSKEFVREWLIANHFMGKEGQQVPTMDDAFVASVTARYVELYEKITGEHFVPADPGNINERVQRSIMDWIG